jgi:hypothetical protein
MDIGLKEYCAGGIDYKMTYTVESISIQPRPTTDASEPSILAIFHFKF